MTGESAQPPGDDDQRLRHMLDAIEGAIADEDYQFMAAVLRSQDLLRPHEVMEHMDEKRRASEDPVEQRRWQDGLEGYSESLSGQEFPEEEAIRMKAIMEGLSSDEATENEAGPQKPEEQGEPERPSEEAESGDGWEDEKFTIAIAKAELDRIMQTQVFAQAKAHATGHTDVAQSQELAAARRVIEDLSEGEIRQQMLKVLDWYVYIHARNHATGHTNVAQVHELRAAHETVDRFASDEEVALRIKKALDKHVFDQAVAHAKGHTNVAKAQELSAAKAVIENYASTPARRDAMLRRLGFL